MERIGLAGRILLILMAALLSVIVVTAGLDVLAYRRAAQVRPVLAPRLIYAAGVIALLQDADAEQRRRVLHLGTNDQIPMQILDRAPDPAPDDVLAPHREDTLRELVGPSGQNLRAFADGHGRIAKVLAPLGDGKTLMIRWIDPEPATSLKLLGLPPSALAGMLGFAVAGLALFTTLREVRPLRRLTTMVNGFDGSAPGALIPGKGAPDIQRLSRAVHAMQTRVAGLLAERSFLIGAISHDLKTYLTRLRLRAEGLAGGDLRGRIIADLDMMTELLETSLAFARGTTSSGSRQAVDLSDLLATEVAERTALGSPLGLEGTFEDDAVVSGDPVALRRVFCNILDNAMTFGNTAVTARVSRTAGMARVVIEDDGPGIPAVDRMRVFDPYVRLERSRSRRTGGSGLGLAIARQIVETHGGTIAVGEAAGGGASIVVAMPLHRPGAAS